MSENPINQPPRGATADEPATGGGVRHAPDPRTHPELSGHPEMSGRERLSGHPEMTGREMSAHPDAAEMRARFNRVLEGPRATAVDGLTVLTGLFAAISPWVVHFQSTNSIMTVNNLVIGLAIAALGVGMALRPMRLLQLGWVLSLLGVWLIVSPWVASLNHSAARSLIWTNAFTGGMAVVLGLAALGVLASGRHTSRV
ncbi:SPW repeat protein [Actinospica durhamensis]|nr:SPW repeat protein [Actinospica durhamensis]